MYSSDFMRHSFKRHGFYCTHKKKSAGFNRDTMQRKALQKEHVCFCQGFSLLDTIIVVQHPVLLHLIQQWMMKGWLPHSHHLEEKEKIPSFVKTHKKRISFLTCRLFLSQMQSASVDSCAQTTWTNLLELFCLPVVARKSSLTDNPVTCGNRKYYSLVAA